MIGKKAAVHVLISLLMKKIYSSQFEFFEKLYDEPELVTNPDETQISQNTTDADRNRIIGGYPCSRYNINTKFMIVLTNYWGVHKCGGTLVSSKWILTAAHCKDNEMEEVLYACDSVTRDAWIRKDGTLSWFCPSYKIKSVYVHPHFCKVNIINDIAMMNLYTDMWASDNIKYVKLPSIRLDGDVSDECDDGLVMGWGTTHREEMITPIDLRCADVKIVKHEFCSWIFDVPVTTLCTQAEVTKDSCYGDSGGPLLCGDIQYGITSWGIKCAAGWPSFYTRVDKYLQFIQTTMKNGAKKLYYFKYFVVSLLLCEKNLYL